MTLFSTILEEKATYRRLLDLRGDLAQMSLNVLQRIIQSLPAKHQTMFGVALLRLSARSSLLPSCFILGGVERESDACTCGGFGDIYKGTFRGHRVCVKMVRVCGPSCMDYARTFKMFSKEAGVWSQVRHPNVLPFYGVHLDGKYRRMCLVSPWMENGNICEYLSINPHANRLSLARDVAHGLTHLHYKNIIHGDLKGPNVLISSSGRACLADFGLAYMSAPGILEWTSVRSSTHGCGTVRWNAPELIESDKGIASKNSDVYAFGCVCYEIFVDAVPFHEITHDLSVILAIVKGKKPSKPSDNSKPFTSWGLTDNIWNLMEQCWDSNPQHRPTAGNASQQLPHPPAYSRKKAQENEEATSRSQLRAAVMEDNEGGIPLALMEVLREVGW
ncbi:kinase-like protein [Macrolepiota fuliginosa MF-IS2]|uniref:Kinase-like protein n=1 Tax=Macrolepiota fuliginosa MF-IS2 TaxID=1400762 RepID=A0A9P5XEV3_9AGAR|nr:kinase-like protein [Macrolepiota fuliginosa MF-IS2]